MDVAIEGEYGPSSASWVRDHVELYESSGGTEGTSMHGVPVVLLVTRGARTGLVRKTPLMRVERDGCYLAVASVAGGPDHPQWYFNVLADPTVELRDGTQCHELVARLLTSRERTLWWSRAVAVFASYARYQSRTRRQIPLFLLEPLRP